MVVTLSVRSTKRTEMIDFTAEVRGALDKIGVDDGICVIYVPHTTAAVTINEGADPDVCRDITAKFDLLVPQHEGYRHAEGNADSHIKASIVGSSVTVIVEGGRLLLGTWQKIFFCEFDGPRSRKIQVTAR